MIRAVAVAVVLAIALPAAAGDDAVAHLRRGNRLYQEGRYDDAIAELKAGYAIDPRPDFLYALGQAERKRGDCNAAIAWYQKYVDTGPSSQRTVATLVQIDRCKQELASAPPQPVAPAPKPEPTPAPPPVETAPPALAVAPAPATGAREHTPVYKRWWLWTTVVGVAVIGAGVGVGLWLAERPTFSSTLPDLQWTRATVGARF